MGRYWSLLVATEVQVEEGAHEKRKKSRHSDPTLQLPTNCATEGDVQTPTYYIYQKNFKKSRNIIRSTARLLKSTQLCTSSSTLSRGLCGKWAERASGDVYVEWRGRRAYQCCVYIVIFLLSFFIIIFIITSVCCICSVTEKYIGILFHTQLNKYLLQYSRWNK